MSSTGPAHKRRRLDSALHKPFRSPLKTATANHSSSSSSNNDGHDDRDRGSGSTASPSRMSSASSAPPKTPSRAAGAAVGKKATQTPGHSLYKPHTPSSLHQTALSRTSEQDGLGEDGQMCVDDDDAQQEAPPPQPQTQTQTKDSPMQQQQQQQQQPASAFLSRPSPPPPPPPQPSSALHPAGDGEVHALEQAVRALEAEARALRTQVETLRQAEGLPDAMDSSNADGGKNEPGGRLNTLMTKWRAVSQDAADQVFADVAARFRDVGGMRGYHRQQRQRKKEQVVEDWAWEKSAGADDVESHARNETMQRAALDAEVQRQEREKEEEEEEDDDEFSMTTMLRMLNIEPGVVGWDERALAWVS